MNKQVISIIGIICVLVIVGFYIADYFAIGKTVRTSSLNKTNTSINTVTSFPASYEVATVAENLKVPWAIAFTSNGSLLVTERAGTIRGFDNGILSDKPLITLPVVAQGESGLMGMVLDPDYQTNKLLYACYTYQNGSSLANRIVQLKHNPTDIVVEATILENAPSARFHAGCELAIGPDKKLYATFGDATDKSLAQNKNSLAGKILRLNLDGSVPLDNPFPDSLIWSIGHRNPQGITWNPENGQMYSVEHGPSGNDGPLGGDEINAIDKGRNYGWPTVSHDKSQAGLIDPMLVFTPAVAPASSLFYTGDVYPELHNTLLFATLKGEALYVAMLDPNDSKKIISYQKMPLPDLGRIREVTLGLDNYIYITTSNTDGRGTPNVGDDKIFKLMPTR